MYFFTADEHYHHSNIIRFCNRPFENTEEMHEVQIGNSNSVVKKDDTVIHAGDFTMLKDRKKIQRYLIDRLNGHHIFLKGSHDYWMPKNKSLQRWEGMIEGHYIVVDHYNMRTWARSHYNSWQLYGHSHGRLEPVGKQWDVGVDNNNFFPVSFDQIREIMKGRPDNPNLIRPEDRNNAKRY